MQNTLVLGSVLVVSALAAEGEYSYSKMGADWTGTCATGKEQSPINFHDFGMQYSDKMKLEVSGYSNQAYTIADVPYTIIAKDVTAGSFVKTFWDGQEQEFLPAQFHFHAPSEHTIGGRHMDLELHVVHLYPDGSLGAVIGVFFDRVYGGESTNSLLNQIGAGTVSESGTSRNLSFKTWLEDLDMADFWSYDGSLTTPPCTEGIKWSVLQQVQPITSSQLNAYSRMWNTTDYANGIGNNREPQPWNYRAVLDSSAWAKNTMPVYTGAAGLAASALAAATLFSSLV